MAVGRLCADENGLLLRRSSLVFDCRRFVVGGAPVFCTARIAGLRRAEIACGVARGGGVVMFCRRGRFIVPPRAATCFVFVAAVFFQPQGRDSVWLCLPL